MQISNKLRETFPAYGKDGSQKGGRNLEMKEEKQISAFLSL